MIQYVRALIDSGSTDDVMTFVASTPGVKSDGLEINQDRWELSRYRSNPVVLFAHEYARPSIGKADVRVDGGRLMADVTWDEEDEFARLLASKYRRGFMNAVSVGWEDVDEDGQPIKRGQTAAKHVLLDISAVPVPGDPDALVERQRAAWCDLGRELLRLSQTDSADGLSVLIEQSDPEVTAMDDEARPDAADEPTDETVNTSDSRGEDPWADVAAGMVAVFDPESDDPDDERERAYRALLPKYRRHGCEPPEFMTAAEVKALDERGLARLFLSGELDAAAWVGTRVAKVLAARNWKRIEQAHGLLADVLADAGGKDAKPDEDNDRAAEVVTPEPVTEDTIDPLASLRAMRALLTEADHE